MMDESGMVFECCPTCGNEIGMLWDIESMGYKAFCPVRGERLMLCSECDSRCDYSHETDTCKYNREGGER